MMNRQIGVSNNTTMTKQINEIIQKHTRTPDQHVGTAVSTTPDIPQASSGSTWRDWCSKDNIIVFCKSRVGMALITTLIIIAILCICKPVYVCQKNEYGQQTNTLNIYSAIFFAVLGGILVYVIPGLLKK